MSPETKSAPPPSLIRLYLPHLHKTASRFPKSAPFFSRARFHTSNSCPPPPLGHQQPNVSRRMKSAGPLVHCFCVWRWMMLPPPRATACTFSHPSSERLTPTRPALRFFILFSAHQSTLAAPFDFIFPTSRPPPLAHPSPPTPPCFPLLPNSGGHFRFIRSVSCNLKNQFIAARVT